ncbi:MAG: hypothetical protein AAGC97_14195, partial [Planctomycetota bacterium]
MATLALFVFGIVMLMVVAGTSSPELLKPGDLTTAHAQILGEHRISDRCATCHNNVSTRKWFSLASTGHRGLGGDEIDRLEANMTDQCLACHHVEMPRATATMAHNLPPAQRDELTRLASTRDASTTEVIRRLIWSGARGVAMDELQCSICHQEHQGSDHDLRAITDARCQSCHTNAFGSFVDSHPEFRHWPDSNSSSLGFDHVRHASIHFPKSSESNADSSASVSFDCNGCHLAPGTATGVNAVGMELADRVVATLPYERACQSCHDSALRVQTRDGPQLLALPTLPDEVITDVDSWPAGATGFADGAVPPLARLLLVEPIDTRSWQSLSNVGSADGNDPVTRQQFVVAASQLRQWMITLSTGGQTALMDRLRLLNVNEVAAERLSKSLAPQLFRDAAIDWFATSRATADTDNNDLTAADPLTLDPLTTDPLAMDPLTDGWMNSDPASGGQNTRGRDPQWEEQVGQRYSPDQMQPLGGWYRDDLTFSIRYRSTGHADPVLRSIIEIAASLPPDDDIRRALLSHGATKACLECHIGSARPPMGNPLSNPWRVQPDTSTGASLHHFSHGPHLNIAGLQDCASCHSMNQDRTKEAEASVAVAEFQPMRQQACAVCHNPQGAGDH